MSLPLTYAISVNANIINKPDDTERKKIDLGKDFQPIEATLDEIFRHVSRGHAMAPQYRNGHRKTSNFIRSGFLAADVDEGMTLEEAKDHPIVRHHAGLIHTTASHTEEKHRFRIIFPLDEPILNGLDWTDAQFALAVALGSDKSVSDGARMFFGSTRATVIWFRQTMPSHVVADLIARGREVRVINKSTRGRLLPLDSARRIAGAEVIKVATGESVRRTRSAPT
jgi:hypothetical protein